VSDFEENIIYKDLILANAFKQDIICKDSNKNKEDRFLYKNIESKFDIGFLKDDLKNLKNRYILSPYAILYELYKEKKDEKALYILNQKDFITYGVFKEGSLIFCEHLKKEKDFDFKIVTEEIIKNFYKGECCYFLERIYLFDCDDIKEKSIKELYESILIEIDVEKGKIEDLLKKIYEKKDNYAYVLFEEKSLFPKWLQIAAIVIFAVLIVIDLYVRVKNAALQEKVLALQYEKQNLQEKISELKEETASLKNILPVVQEIKSQNMLIVSNIKNVFDLIPDQIYLFKAEFDKDRLVLVGFTPSKAIFDSYLNKNLKNFYQKGEVRFKKLKSGYKFISINYESVRKKDGSKK